MDKCPLFPDACFDFHMGRGHGRKVNPSRDTQPIPQFPPCTSVSIIPAQYYRNKQQHSGYVMVN